LETVALGIDSDIDSSTVSRGRLESLLSRIVATGGQLIASRVRESEGLAVGANEGVSERVEGETTGKGHSSHDIGRCDEGVGGWVSVVTSSEVTVVGSNDYSEHQLELS
jgi:hypothetical protein